MARIAYQPKNFSTKSYLLIEKCITIIKRYDYALTLRQLYYRLVAAAVIENSVKSYNNLGNLINNARLAGLIDWDSLQDRTRNLRSVAHWDTPADIIASAAHSFRLDKWATQGIRPEVWIEKDALVGAIDQVCAQNDVAFFSCRGYTSQSEMWAAAQRFIAYNEVGQTVHIIHLGDHDPSGKDMSRDIEERIRMFMEYHRAYNFQFERIALNLNQIEMYEPPPNPAKQTDTRFAEYAAEFGEESWELDALEPNVIVDLIQDAIDRLKDDEPYETEVTAEMQHRTNLREAAHRWTDVERFLENDDE